MLLFAMLFIDIQNATVIQERVGKSILSWFDKNFFQNYEVEITVIHTYLREHSAVMYVSGDLENPTEFTIEVHKYLNGIEYEKTLIHELIHIEDYVKGVLTEKNGNRYWNGVFYENSDYSNQPWEIRANSLENFYQELYHTTHFEICQAY